MIVSPVDLPPLWGAQKNARRDYQFLGKASRCYFGIARRPLARHVNNSAAR
jgi:hypothetical protein